MALFSAERGYYRFMVLFFNCLLTFGSYFCFDMPSVLQSEFEGNSTCVQSNGTSSNASSCCTDCLGMSPDDYNLLYAIYAWTNAVVVIGAGYLIDKLGNRVGAFFFSSLCLIGSSLFAAGALLKNTPSMLPLMLVARLIFGSGNGSLTIVQNRITTYWFHDKELALAFGFTLAFSRLGSVLNFFLTPTFAASFGLTWTLWAGAFLCSLGFISALVVSFLDHIGMKQLGLEDDIKLGSKKVAADLNSVSLHAISPNSRIKPLFSAFYILFTIVSTVFPNEGKKFTDIRFFSLRYWLLTLTIMFFYNGILPFVADASMFIQDKYSFDKKTASYMAGAVYDVSMLISPFLGFFIDVFGKRGFLAVACAVLTLPVFGLLAFTHVYPVILTLWLGFTYSFAAASMWPSIPLVVKPATIGTAMGLTTSIQMVGIGISNAVVGAILGESDNIPVKERLLHWKYVMVYLLLNTVACVITASLLNIIDKRHGGSLNMSRREKRLVAQLSVTPDEPSISHPSYYDDEDDQAQETDRLLAGTSRTGYINTRHC